MYLAVTLCWEPVPSVSVASSDPMIAHLDCLLCRGERGVGPDTPAQHDDEAAHVMQGIRSRRRRRIIMTKMLIFEYLLEAVSSLYKERESSQASE